MLTSARTQLPRVGLPETRKIGARRYLNLGDLVKKAGGDASQSYTLQKRFGYPQSLVYEVVSQVDRYQEFIPYCKRSFVSARDEKGQPKVAGLDVGFKGFDEVFTCDLHCEKPTLVAAKSVTPTLFETLQTEWTIVPVGATQCNVQLKLRYEFKSVLYNQVSQLFAQKIAGMMTKSFERRAYDLSRGKTGQSEHKQKHEQNNDDMQPM